jgi:hypothetical protein
MKKLIYDYGNSRSWAYKARKKRFDFFIRNLNKIPKPLKILDIGGTQAFWDSMGFEEDPEIQIYLLNLEHQKVKRANFKSIKGDATNLSQYEDNFFQMVFSNSVIEHLFTWENQLKMANEIRRVGKYHFIQTPNYWFPIEPHFVFPFFQYLPKKSRVSLVKNFSLGHHPKYTDAQIARSRIEEVRLLTIKEVKKLFPDSNIYREKFLGLNKSIVAYRF